MATRDSSEIPSLYTRAVAVTLQGKHSPSPLHPLTPVLEAREEFIQDAAGLSRGRMKEDAPQLLYPEGKFLLMHQLHGGMTGSTRAWKRRVRHGGWSWRGAVGGIGRWDVR